MEPPCEAGCSYAIARTVGTATRACPPGSNAIRATSAAAAQGYLRD